MAAVDMSVSAGVDRSTGVTWSHDDVIATPGIKVCRWAAAAAAAAAAAHNATADEDEEDGGGDLLKKCRMSRMSRCCILKKKNVKA